MGMVALKCPACGADIQLDEGREFGFCNYCGTKVMQDKIVVEHQGSVKVDNSEYVEKFLKNARRAKQKEDWKETEKYYNLVEQNDPTNIEAIFYSSFAQVKLALLEKDSKEKRQNVFNVLKKSVSVIDDNYDNANEEHQTLIFEIMDDINRLKSGTIVPTTHLQEYVTKNGYGNIVDRNQVVEDDDLSITYGMIDQVIRAYGESIVNITVVQCKDLSTEEVLEKALDTLQNGYFHFSLGYFDEYEKRNPNSPVGYAGEALTICATGSEIKGLNHFKKVLSLTASGEEKDIFNSIINCNKYSGLTLLMFACANYDYEVTEYLVNAGVNINATSNSGVTALWFVSYKTPPAAKVVEARKIAKLLLDNGADIHGAKGIVATYNLQTDSEIRRMIKEKFPNAKLGFSAKKSGCYVATAVYGSYDCPQVWTLRRYRDYSLALTWYGRLFIALYYAISPTIVKWFGSTNWFNKMWKGRLDKMVNRLQEEGFKNTPYEDKNW